MMFPASSFLSAEGSIDMKERTAGSMSSTKLHPRPATEVLGVPAVLIGGCVGGHVYVQYLLRPQASAQTLDTVMESMLR